MERAAEFVFGLSRGGLRAVYCSGLSRARRSAEIVARPFGLEPVVVEALRERSFGAWEGMTWSEIAERFPEEFEAWAHNPLRYSPPGGESTLEVCQRVVKAFDELLQDGSFAVVAHGGVNRVLLCHLMGIPLENIFRIEQDYASVNVIEFQEHYPLVRLLNGGPGG